MRKRELFWAGAVLVGVGAVIGVIAAAHHVHDVTLTQAALQERINAKLPFTKDELTVTRVDATLDEQTIHLRIAAEGTKWGQPFTVIARAHGKPSYDPDSGSFHFAPDAIIVEELTIRGGTVSSKVSGAIDRFVDSPKILAHTDTIAGKIEAWVASGLEHVAVWVLARIPVYTLPDTLKGNVFRLLIDSMEVHEDSFTLHLSLWRLTATVLIWALIFLVSLAVVIILIRHPELGLAVAEGAIEGAIEGASAVGDVTDLFD